ncbi:hypothetical protein ACTFIR_012571 [Dictyostelium discoideum]
MKTLQLFSFLFLIFLISISNAVKVNQNRYVENNKKKCDVSGFSANYTCSSINVVMSYVSYVIPFTYFEKGFLMHDYENQIGYFQYQDTIDGVTVVGQCFDFYANNTQYVYVNGTGTDACFITTPQINVFEKVNNLEKTVSITVGSMQCDVYENTFGVFNYTKQQTVVDSSDCSIVSIYVQNDLFFPGDGVWNFFNYQPKATKVQVPSVCFEKPQSIQNYPKNFPFSHRFFK